MAVNGTPGNAAAAAAPSTNITSVSPFLSLFPPVYGRSAFLKNFFSYFLNPRRHVEPENSKLVTVLKHENVMDFPLLKLENSKPYMKFTAPSQAAFSSQKSFTRAVTYSVTEMNILSV